VRLTAFMICWAGGDRVDSCLVPNGQLHWPVRPVVSPCVNRNADREMHVSFERFGQTAVIHSCLCLMCVHPFIKTVQLHTSCWLNITTQFINAPIGRHQ